MTRKVTSQRGVVALATTIIVGILLIVITLSTIALMIGEQRQSTDADQSIRAYYAAEGAVEDQLLAIKTALNSGLPLPTTEACNQSDAQKLLQGILNLCNSLNLQQNCIAPGPPAVNGVAVTCVTVKREQTQLIGILAKEKSYQVDGTGKTFNKLRVSWNLAGDSPHPVPNITGFPRGSDWVYPAVIDLTIIYYPTTPTFLASDSNFGHRTLILKPRSTSEPAEATINFTNHPNNSPVYADCQVSGTAYFCDVEITGFDTTVRNFMVRMRPRYGGTSYKLEFLNGNTPVAMPDQVVTIDATARAGDVYRRVISKLQVQRGLLSGLDYVLFSDKGICKDFEVNNSTDVIEQKVCPF